MKSVVKMVSFGMVTPAIVVTVDRLPDWNTGAEWDQRSDFISDDAAIVAILSSKWAVSSGLICNALGDDAAGRNTFSKLRTYGVQHCGRLQNDIETPLGVVISDRRGGRTYLWRRDQGVLDTLDSADISMIADAQVLYVDWYDGEHWMRPIMESVRHGVPTFFNIEYAHSDRTLLQRIKKRVRFIQGVTNENQIGGDASSVAKKLLSTGAEIAIVTEAEKGCLAMTANQNIRITAPGVDVVDACAAGATLSAGYIYGFLREWSMIQSLRFGVAAASLQCTRVGPVAFPVEEIRDLAETLHVESFHL